MAFNVNILRLSGALILEVCLQQGILNKNKPNISSRQSSQKEAIGHLTSKNDQIECQGITNAFASGVSVFENTSIN